jgi:hypothetical protein
LLYDGGANYYDLTSLKTFIFLSDNHNQRGKEKFRYSNVDLIVSGGDNANDAFLQDIFAFFKDYPKDVPFLTAIGNHDRRMNEDVYGFDRNYYT